MSAPPGWNDPPKYVPPPTGNLKISLNKRVAFPLSASPSATSSATSSSPAPHSNISLPPSMPPSGIMPDLLVTTQSKIDDESKDDETVVLNAQKQNVLECLKGEVEKMDSQVKSNVSLKLKSLEDDWEQLDDVMKKLLIELVEFLKVNDAKGAALIQRKIVMKGSSKPWLHATRQIILNAETRKHPDELETTE